MLKEKFSENVSGPYYVTRVCIGCMLCGEIAPYNFTENTDEDLFTGNSFVYKQPENDAEVRMCEEAMDLCPANAICDDGTAPFSFPP